MVNECNDLFIMPISSLEGITVEALAKEVQRLGGKLPLDVLSTASGAPVSLLTPTQLREACTSEEGFLLCVGSSRLAKLAFMATGDCLTYTDTSRQGRGAKHTWQLGLGCSHLTKGVDKLRVNTRLP